MPEAMADCTFGNETFCVVVIFVLAVPFLCLQMWDGRWVEKADRGRKGCVDDGLGRLLVFFGWTQTCV